tara:strand:+ start:9933 stop:10796 length:864 start_codon:yes stop_codon:yes gene_type:complete
MNPVNWSEVLFRCSCIGKIMTEGKGSVLTDKQSQELDRLESLPMLTEKQELTLFELLKKKNAPPTLSDTCISYLKEMFVFNKYGKEPVGGAERSKYTLKGKAVEDESIMMLSRIDTIPYEKNAERITNEFLTGEPDIIVRDLEGIPEKIIDIKSSYDFATLLANYGKSLNPLYHDQVQGYMALTGAKSAEICYCLVNMPQEIIEGEKRRIFYAINPATEEDPYYKKQIERIEYNMTFDEIPITERILRFPVQRDDAYIEKIYKRIKDCRSWLEEFENMFINLNKNEK